MPNDRGAVVVTGGGGGMGLACARHFSPELPLILAEAAEERLSAAVAELEGAGAEVVPVVCDVTDPAGIERLAAAAEGFESLRTIVHTAGLSSSMASGRRILAVNLLGTARVLEALLPLAGEGTVAVCIASISGHRRRAPEFDALLTNPLREGMVDELEAAVGEMPGSVGYSLSKRGVILLCETEARRWGERGARLVSISPGIVDTPMGQRELGTNAAGLIAASAVGRIGVTEDIVAAVDFLSSARASFITGADLRIDGGSVATFRHHSDQEARERWDDPWKAAVHGEKLAAEAEQRNA